MEDTTNPTPETEDAPDRMEEFCQSFVDSITLFMDTVEATGADVERLFGFVDSFNVGMQKLREVHRQEDFKFQREQGKVIAELIEAGIPEDIINRLVFGDPDSKTESINETLMAKVYETLPSLMPALMNILNPPTLYPGTIPAPRSIRIIGNFPENPLYGGPSDGVTIYYQKDDTVARLTIEVLSILKLPRDEWATLYLSVIDSNGLQVELPDDMLIDSIPEDMKPVMVVRKVPVAE